MELRYRNQRIQPRDKDITQDYLKSIVEYNYESGVFTWQQTKSGRSKKEAGSVHSDGYCHIMIDAVSYQTHRLVWLYCNGELPPVRSVDHINRNRSDNRISNLRIAKLFQNGHNKNLLSNNKSGLRGIRFKKNRWEVSCMINNKRKYLGRYMTKQEAVAAYNNYAGPILGEFFNPIIIK